MAATVRIALQHWTDVVSLFTPSELHSRSEKDPVLGQARPPSQPQCHVLGEEQHLGVQTVAHQADLDDQAESFPVPNEQVAIVPTQDEQAVSVSAFGRQATSVVALPADEQDSMLLPPSTSSSSG